MHIYIINTTPQLTQNPINFVKFCLLLNKYHGQITLIDENLKAWEFPPSAQPFSILGLPGDKILDYLALKFLEGDHLIIYWITSNLDSTNFLDSTNLSKLNPTNSKQKIIFFILIEQPINNNYNNHNGILNNTFKKIILYSKVDTIIPFITILSEWLISNNNNITNVLNYFTNSILKISFENLTVNETLVKDAATQLYNWFNKTEDKTLPESFWDPIDKLGADIEHKECSQKEFIKEELISNLNIKNPEDAYKLPEWFRNTEKIILETIQDNLHEQEQCLRKESYTLINATSLLAKFENEISSVETEQNFNNIINTIELKIENEQENQKNNNPFNHIKDLKQTLETLEQRMYQAINTIKRIIPKRNIIIPLIFTTLISIIALIIPLIFKEKIIHFQLQNIKYDVLWIILLIISYMSLAIFIYKKEQIKIKKEIESMKTILDTIVFKMTKILETQKQFFASQIKLNILLQINTIAFLFKKRMEIIFQKRKTQQKFLSSIKSSFNQPQGKSPNPKSNYQTFSFNINFPVKLTTVRVFTPQGNQITVKSAIISPQSPNSSPILYINSLDEDV